jgi:hypothetical protein
MAFVDVGDDGNSLSIVEDTHSEEEGKTSTITFTTTSTSSETDQYTEEYTSYSVYTEEYSDELTVGSQLDMNQLADERGETSIANFQT